MILPYAVAPAVAAVLWIFLFNPGSGVDHPFLNGLGYNWNHAQNSGGRCSGGAAPRYGADSYNFLFSSRRCNRSRARWWRRRTSTAPARCGVSNHLVLPLIAPVSFFLLVVNLVYAFFDTFPVIDAATAAGRCSPPPR